MCKDEKAQKSGLGVAVNVYLGLTKGAGPTLEVLAVRRDLREGKSYQEISLTVSPDFRRETPRSSRVIVAIQPH